MVTVNLLKKLCVGAAAICLATVVFTACGTDKQTNRLDTPCGVTFEEDEVLRWQGSPNAQYYTVRVNEDTYNVFDTQFDLFDILDTYGEYSISVRAMTDDLSREPSDYSDPIPYEIKSEKLLTGLAGNKVLITNVDNEKTSGKVIIPAEIEGKPVFGISGSAFKDCTSITSVILPDSITFLGTEVFSGCTALRRVRLSNELTSLPVGAFSGCTSLLSVKLPENTVQLKNSAFEGCTALREVIVPDSLQKIGSSFAGCTALSELHIPSRVTEISYNAFSGCEDIFLDIDEENNSYRFDGNCLIEINIKNSYAPQNAVLWGNANSVIPDYVTDIKSYAFCGSKITELALPSSVKSIGISCFSECSELRNISIPNGVAELLANTFYACKKLETVILPDSVKSIGMFTFNQCPSLREIDISKVTKLPVHVFNDCTGLRRVNIGDNTADIEGAFDNCPNIESFTVSADNPMYTFHDSCLIRKTDNTLIYYSRDLGYDLPQDVKRIGNYALSGFKRDYYIVPTTVNYIGDYAFYHSDMYYITVPNSVTHIGSYAFYYCLNHGLSVTIDINENAEYEANCVLTPENTLYKRGIIDPGNVEFRYDNDIPYVYSVSPNFDIAIPFRKGYRFAGWSVEEGGPAVYLPKFVDRDDYDMDGTYAGHTTCYMTAFDFVKLDENGELVLVSSGPDTVYAVWVPETSEE